MQNPMVNLQARIISGHNHSYDTESEHLNFLKISVGSEYTYNVQKQTFIEDTDITVAEVDIDNNQGIATEFGVRGVPTYVAFKNGDQVGSVSGAREKNMLVNMFE